VTSRPLADGEPHSSANDNTQASGKKTIAPGDVLNALKDSEFETFLPRLEAELKSTYPCLSSDSYGRMSPHWLTHGRIQ
jgi:hypothetical protein